MRVILIVSARSAVRSAAPFLALVILFLQTGIVNAGDAKFSIGLLGASNEQLEVIVDTRELGDIVIGEATFSAEFRDQQNNTMARKSYSFLDSKLSYLTPGHVYRRRYYHPATLPRSVASSGLRIVEQGAGGKADGPSSTVVATALSVPEPDVSIFESNPARLAEYRRPPAAEVFASYDGNRVLRTRCQEYANSAISQETANQARHCGYSGSRWVSNFTYHFDWCAAVADDKTLAETTERNKMLRDCASKVRKP